MNKIKKVWFRLNYNQTINKEFTADYYRALIKEWDKKYGFIPFSFTGKKPGILLRHDIDADLNKAVRMAEIEAGKETNLNLIMFQHGEKAIVKSTYFVLNTAKYWGSAEMIGSLKYIRSLGHEIGWHNNSITEHLKTGKPLEKCILEPLDYLRSNGVIIRGSAAHGDRLCYKEKYINYNVFGFSSPGWNWGGEKFHINNFNLEYEAYFVPYDYFLADCHTGWNGVKDESQWKGKRIQIIIHPQNWKV